MILLYSEGCLTPTVLAPTRGSFRHDHMAAKKKTNTGSLEANASTEVLPSTTNALVTMNNDNNEDQGRLRGRRPRRWGFRGRPPRPRHHRRRHPSHEENRHTPLRVSPSNTASTSRPIDRAGSYKSKGKRTRTHCRRAGGAIKQAKGTRTLLQSNATIYLRSFDYDEAPSPRPQTCAIGASSSKASPTTRSH